MRSRNKNGPLFIRSSNRRICRIFSPPRAQCAATITMSLNALQFVARNSPTLVVPWIWAGTLNAWKALFFHMSGCCIPAA
jgi:hypothetical protein